MSTKVNWIIAFFDTWIKVTRDCTQIASLLLTLVLLESPRSSPGQDRVVSYDEEESEKSSHYGIKL